MANISIIARSGATTSTVSGETASLISPSIVKINISPRDVAGLERSGNDLVISLRNGEKITIENYFVLDTEGHRSELVLEDQNGALWWVEEPTDGLHFAPLADIDALLITQSSTEGAMPWILGALGIGAGMAAAAASIGSSGNHHHNADEDPADNQNGGPEGSKDNDPDDNTLPGIPTLPTENNLTQVDNVTELTITDNVEQYTGSIAKGGFTNDNTPTLSGKALANSTVTIYDGETRLGSVTANAKGLWSFTPAALDDGVHSFTTTVSKGDISSGKSGAYVVTIDTHAPGEVTLFIATDNQTPVLGTISANETTNDNTPVISGKAEPGSTVNIYDFGKLVGSAQADVHGNWGLELSTVLGEGKHSLSANATDLAGNIGPSTAPLVFYVDTEKPVTMGAFTVSDDTGGTVVTLPEKGTTTDTTPTFSGAAGSVEDGTTVSVYQGTTLLGTATVAPDGSWHFTPDAPLPAGNYSFHTVVTDAAGNNSGDSPSFNLTIAPPASSVTVTSVDDDVNPGAGALANGASTNDTTPAFTGTGPASGTITVYINGIDSGTVTADAQGIWHFTPPALADGHYRFTFSSDGGATLSEPFVLTVDTQAPDGVSDLTIVDDLNPGIGQLHSGDSTNDGTPVISGSAEPGSTVSIYDGGKLIGTALVGTDGQWGFTPAPALSEGTHAISTVVTDAAGNASAASPDFVLMVDTTAPAPVTAFIATDNVDPNVGTIVAGDVTNDSTPILSGKAEPGSEIIIYDAGVEIARTVTDTKGNWGLELTTPLSDGPHGLTVVAVDAAGNASQPTDELVFSVDTSAPLSALSIVVTDNIGPVQGQLTSGGTTDDTTPGFSGLAAPGTTVSIYDGATLLGQATTDTSGHWSFTPDAPLADGLHHFTTVVTDAAGNASPSSLQFDLTITPIAGPISGLVVTDNVAPVQGPLANGAATNDDTPTFSGKADPNSTLTVYDNGAPVATVPVDGSGNWSYTPSSALGEGTHSVTFTVDNGSGPSAPSEPFMVTVDTTAPDPVANLIVVDDQALGVGQLASGGVTNDSTPIISGTAEAGSTVTIYDGSTIIGTVQADDDGLWGFIPDSPLLDGTHQITTAVVDAAGNTSPLSPPFVLEVDSSAPATITGLVVSDNVDLKVGPISDGGVTNDNTPTLNGMAEINATVTIYDGTTVLGTTQANGSGEWNFTPDTPLGDGPHSLTATVTDMAGNTSPHSPAFNLTVDTAPPERVTGVTITADSGVLAPGTSTNDTTLTVSGSSEPNALITVYDTDGATVLGTIQAGPTGSWSLGVTLPDEGPHVITATATDAAGNVGPASLPTVVVIDLTLPPPIAGITVTDTLLPGTGIINANDRINDNRPTLSGSVEANSTVNIYNGTTLVATTQADASGNWSVKPTTALGDGDYTLTATATDRAGNTSIASPGFSFTVDTRAPGLVTGLTVAADGTPLAGGASTNDTTPTISGVSEEGATITVYDTNGTTVLGTTVAGSGGTWSINLPVLGEGSHTLTATATDVAGNEGPKTSVVVVIDTVPPAQITGVTVTDNLTPTTGTVTAGTEINDPSPRLSGTADPNSFINVYNGATLIGSGQADGNGYWSFAPTVPLLDGNYSLTATATDAAGNVSTPSPAFTFSVDTTRPDPITTLIVTDNEVPDIGIVPNGGSTNDTTPTFSGKVEPGATVILYNGSDILATIKADTSGNWSFTPAPLDQGTYRITATVTDLAGNVSKASAEFVLILDTAAPTAAPTFTVSDNVDPKQEPILNGDSTNDPTPTLTGTAEFGAIVTIYNGTTVLGTAKASPTDGRWSFTPTVDLKDGEYNLTATATDAAGNVGPASSPAFTLFIDTVPPDNITNLTVSDNVSPVIALLNSGDSTNDSTPTFSGHAEAGTTVTFYNNGTQLLGTAVADGNGVWIFEPTLGNGDYSITTTVTDKAGNVSTSISPAFELKVDTDRPQPIGSFVVTDSVTPVTTNVGNGGATNDTLPVIRGTAEPNSNVILFDNDKWVATIEVNGAGDWSYQPTTALTQGSHSYTTIVEDAAGNQSDASDPYVIIVDSIAPDAVTGLLVSDNASPATGPLADGASTNDTTPVFSGHAEAGTTVALYEGATLLGEVLVGPTGEWRIESEAITGEGEHTLTVVVTDAAGNVSTNNPVFTLNIDTLAPAAVSTITATDNVAPQTGAITNGFTNDTTPTFSGTAEKGSTVTVYDGSTQLGTTTASTIDGSWSFTPTTPLDEKTYAIKATATDAAGNEGPASPVFSLTVDTTAPGPVTDLAINGSKTIGITNDDTLTLSGTAEKGSTVTIYNGSTPVATVTASDTDGSWSLTTDVLTDATYNFITTVTDKAGNVGSPSASFTVTVDTKEPDKPGNITASDNVPLYEGTITSGLTNDRTPTLSGVVEPNALVTIYQGSNVLGTVSADAAGKWSYTVPSIDTDGTYTFHVTATDTAGNVSVNSEDLVLRIDGTAPLGIAVLVVTQDSAGLIPVVGDNNRPYFSSVALTDEVGSTVNIYDNGKLIGSTTIDAFGAWSFRPDAPLADGEHKFTTKVVDQAGNESPLIVGVTLNIDTHLLNGGITDLVVSDNIGPIQGAITSGGVTDDSQPTFTGKAPVGSTIAFYDNTNLVTPIGTATVDSGGNWTFTPTVALGDGVHLISAVVRNPLPLTGITPLFQFTVDTKLPDKITDVVVTDDVTPGVGPITSGDTTNDRTPTFSGIEPQEVGSTVIITEGSTEIGRATVGALGVWSITPTTPLGDGPHSFVIKMVDLAGNESPVTVFNLTIDTTPPAQITAFTVSDDALPVIANIAQNGFTNDTTPTLNGAAGSAEAGSTIRVYDGIVLLGSTTAQADGSWTFETPTLLNGRHSLTVTATDALGNVSLASPAFNFTVDTVAPTPILALTVSNNVDSPALANGAITNDNTPIISGRAEANSSVSVYNGTTLVGTTTADSSGNWSLAPSTLGDGTYSLTATATDAAGNVSLPSPAFTLNIDTAAPATPGVFTLTDNTAPITGNVTEGSAINDTRPVLRGAAGSVEGNALVSVYDGTTLLGTTRAEANGSWTFTPLTALGNTSHALSITATDAAGNVSANSPAFNVTVDTVAPAIPSAITVNDNVGPITGNLTNNGVTDDTLPQLSGTVEPGATVKVYDNGVLLTTTPIVSDSTTGQWTFQISTALTQGAHSFTVTATDAAGNVSLPSPVFAVTVDTTAPPPISNFTVTDDVSPVIGTLTSGSATNDNRPTISGTGATPGATVIIMDGTNEIGRTEVNALGGWSFTPAATAPLAEGPHSLTLLVSDAAGNTSAATSAFTLTVDTVTPAVGALPIVSDNAGAVTGDLVSGALSDDNTPTLRGTVEPNAFVNIYDGSTLLATVQANGSGAWTFTPSTQSALSDGIHRFSTTISDAAGNVSGASPVFTLNIDTTAPVAATNITVTDNVGPVTGLVANGGATNDNMPTLNGTAEANSTVTIYNGNTVLGTTLAGATGAWSFTPTELTDGTYTLSTTVTDQVGNVGPRSPDFVLTVDTVAPATMGALTVTDDVAPGTSTIGNNGRSNDNLPAISGVSEAGATITVYDGTKVLGTTTAVAGGAWSFTPTVALADGVHTFTAIATDAAGNVSGTSPVFTLNIDTVAPGAITGLTVTDDVAPDLGNLTSGSITNDTRPTFTGVAEANSTVNIYDGGTFVISVTAGANGQWTWTPTAALTSTTHSFTFSASDAAGNEGPKTPAFTLTIDPTIGTQILSAVNDEAGLSLTTSIQQITAPTNSTAQNLNVLNLGVGDLLTVNLIQANQLPTFHVDEGASRALSLQASAVGVTLLSTFDLYIYKSNGDGTYSMYQRYDDFLRVLALASISASRNVTLPAGDYALLLRADDGLSLLTGSQLKVTSDVTTGVFVDTASGTTTGNVMTGVGGGGVDSTPKDTVVSGVSIGSSSNFTAVSGNTVISGTYGTLTINAQGDYTYTLKAGLSPYSITGPDVFNYQIKAPNGSISSAKLTIDLNLPNLHANSDVVTLEVDPIPADVTTPGVTSSSLILANVSLGDSGSILGLNLDLTKQLQIDVGANSTRTFTLDGTAAGLAIGATFDLYIYKYNTTTGQYVQDQFFNNWISAPLLVGSTTDTFTLGTGHYLFLLKADGLIAAGTVATLKTSKDVTHTYQAAVESVTGNVITGAGNTSGGVDVAPAGTVVSNVNGQTIAATGNTTIVGQYGNLVINAQGVYTYTLKTGQPATALGQETFTYAIRNGTSVSTATLTISLPPVGSAVTAQSMMLTSALLADESVVQETTLMHASVQSTAVQETASETLMHTALVLEFTALPTASGKADYQILDDQGHLIASGTLTTDATTLTASIPLDNTVSSGGPYNVVLLDNAGNTLNSEFSTILTSVAVTPEAAAAGVTAEGQIAEIASGALWASITLSNESGQQISEVAGSTQSQTLEGLYGTLTLHADGSYSYTLREGVSVVDLTQREQFDYTLKAPDGTLSHGSLTIDLHPHVEGSDKNDAATSSAYDDTYTLGDGGDTVIFNLLDSHDATGGNGHNNHWTDFSVSDGDHIDISKLLTDWSGKSEDLGQYLSIEHTASGDTVVSIDRDGAGTQYQSTQLITLEGVQPTLEELLHQDSSASHG